MIENIVSDFLRPNSFPDQTELRLQQNTSKRVTFLNGDLIANSSSQISGVSARVYKNGIYGFAASPLQDAEGIEKVLRAARDNAVLLDSRENLGKPPFAKVLPHSEYVKPTAREDKVSQKTIIDFLAQIDEYVKKTCPKLISRIVTSPCLDMEKMLVTSDGVFSHSYVPHASLYIVMTAMSDDGVPTEILEPLSDFGTFDEVFTSIDSVCKKSDALYEQLMHKCEGVFAQSGKKQCILAPELAGMLAHEAVGHTVEADFVVSGSVAGPCLNKQVASELVSMVDFANTAFGKECPVPVYVDDEGVTAKDALLIENGILKGYMHNRESALRFGVDVTGNARAFSFSDEPLIRMRNTAVLPGKSKLEDMIASIDDGYYCVRSSNGQADSTGEFMFGVDLGYEIKNGKLGKALKSTTISGVAFDMLKTVTMVSDDFLWVSSGMCGKKQPIPVSMGGPAIKCELMIGGK